MATAGAPQLDDVFAALADPTRRAIVERLLVMGELSVGDVATPFAVSASAITRHLQVLERARLIERRVERQWRYVRVRSDALMPVENWLSRQPRHWVGRIASLRARAIDHPWNDTLPSLVRTAIAATRKQPYWNRRQKAFFALWVVTCAFTPRPFVDAAETSGSLMRAGRSVFGSM